MEHGDGAPLQARRKHVENTSVGHAQETPSREGRSLHDPHMMLYRAFHAQQGYLRPRMARIGLGPGQPKLLGFIAQNGPSTQRQMAQYFEIDAAAVSRMLDSLKRNGFIEEHPCKDRRCHQCNLTPRGHEALRQWDAYCDTEKNAMLQGFTPDEARQFMDYLQRAHDNLLSANLGAADASRNATDAHRNAANPDRSAASANQSAPNPTTHDQSNGGEAR
ncbi:MAG: MarR family winged helix-turn-helix transcriptional regulator [Atopobiaceae bacterium]